MPIDLAELLLRIPLAKDEAKVLRDERDYDGAIARLRRVIEEIERSGWNDGLTTGSHLDEKQRKIAWHLTDCLGMLGGNFRRNKQLDEAITSFDRGSKYEQEKPYRVATSYNTVNAIVAPIENKLRDAASQSEALARAVATIRQQIYDPDDIAGGRSGDCWAWADLGQCNLLLGDFEAATAAYQQFIQLADRDAIRSSRDVLVGLRKALTDQHDATADTVAKGIDLLESVPGKK
jgi:tetratricopeptide (TPR) repeat protein